MSEKKYTPFHQLLAWCVHIFTASMAIVGVLTLNCIHNHQYIAALWLMGVAIFIDAIDGTFARIVNVKAVLPSIDGALLDNIADYLNYVITPCFFLIVVPHLLPPPLQWLVVSAICLSSAYQFTQADAKTADHFFKGFPSYWNIVVFYIYLFSQTHPYFNVALLLFLACMVFVPIKYVYPSRLDYLTEHVWLKKTMLLTSILYGLDCLLLLYSYPYKAPALVMFNLIFIVFYLSFSLFRTYVPLIRAKLKDRPQSIKI